MKYKLAKFSIYNLAKTLTEEPTDPMNPQLTEKTNGDDNGENEATTPIVGAGSNPPGGN